jgi:MFS family permease
MTARQRLIVALLLGANFMTSADFSILNVALPVVGAAVGLSIDNLPWVSTAFALPAAGLSLLFGRLGDLYGRRRIFLTGLFLLSAASLLGSISTEPALLIAARALQGVASAMTAPAALSLLITTFADERQRARVLGLNGSLLSGGFTVGALVGGMLVGVLSWRWAFLINVPVALVILALTLFVVPSGRSRANVRLDVPGAASVTLGLLALAFGITEGSLPALVVGMILLALFFWIERRAKAPLVAIEMLALPSVRWGNLAALTIFSMEAGLVFLTTLYLQNVLPKCAAPRAAGNRLGFWRSRTCLSGCRRCRQPIYRPPRCAHRPSGGIACPRRPHRADDTARHSAGLAVAANPGAVRRLLRPHHRRCRRDRHRHLGSPRLP